MTITINGTVENIESLKSLYPLSSKANGLTRQDDENKISIETDRFSKWKQMNAEMVPRFTASYRHIRWTAFYRTRFVNLFSLQKQQTFFSELLTPFA